MIIREELPGDIPGVRRVEEAAFGRAEEANLVDGLRWRTAVTLSLVALEDDQIIGHALFSPAYVISGSVHLPCEALWARWLFCRNFRSRALVPRC